MTLTTAYPCLSNGKIANDKRRRGKTMKAFLFAIIAAVGMAFVAATILETSQRSAEKQFSSSTSVRH
jgi:hypothetical protein